MAAKTLEMLHTLADFEEACLQAEVDTRDRKTESAELDRVNLVWIRARVLELKQAIRTYRAPKKATG